MGLCENRLQWFYCWKCKSWLIYVFIDADFKNVINFCLLRTFLKLSGYDYLALITNNPRIIDSLIRVSEYLYIILNV